MRYLFHLHCSDMLVVGATDRWFNPSDTTAYQFAMYNFEVTSLQKNKWHQLFFDWDFTNKNTLCRVTDGNGKDLATLALNRESIDGLSYVHFISTAEQEDVKGFLIGKVKSKSD